jgi:hypothetical protein
VLDHLVGDRELERAEIFAGVHVCRDHERDPPRQSAEYATGARRATIRFPRGPREVGGGSVRLLLCRREATGLRVEPIREERDE